MKRVLSFRILSLIATVLSVPLLTAGCGSPDAAQEATQDTQDAQDYYALISTAASDVPEVFPDFETVDLNGNAVTQEIFSEAGITVVNIWATFCSPCIEEMPELAAWYEEMPENVQIIGIVADIADETDGSAIADAEEIVLAAGASYPNLIPCGGLSSLLYSIPGYPTTYFVDNDGDIVDVPFYGANVSSYQYIVEQFLDGAYDASGDLIRE